VEGGWTKRLGEALRRYLVAGVLAFAPLGITIWAVAWIIQRLDNLLLPSVLAMFGLETPTRVPLASWSAPGRTCSLGSRWRATSTPV
jgi:hypothetical protein